MRQLAARLWQEEEGQGLTEYALLLVLVSLVAVGSVKNLASTVDRLYSHATADIIGYNASSPTDYSHRSGFQLKSSPSQSHWEWHLRTLNPRKNDSK